MEKNRENFEREILKVYIDNQVRKYEQYFSLPLKFYQISEEMAFSIAQENCNGFCPECDQMLKCEVYKETKDAWDRFCS